eukprot:10157964-Alexandrium_andersonii.AAC.1
MPVSQRTYGGAPVCQFRDEPSFTGRQIRVRVPSWRRHRLSCIGRGPVLEATASHGATKKN